ncbi:MAG: hypothetical protein ABH864_00415 [archaeon]
MSKRKLIREEDKQAIVDLVGEEIAAHRAGILDRLSTNTELSKMLGCSVNYVSEIFRGKIPDDIRAERQRIIARDPLVYGSTPAEEFLKNRVLAGKRAYEKTLADRTEDQKRELGKKNYRKGLALLTLERRRAIWGEGLGRLTTEQRRANWKKGFGKKTFEEMSANGKRAGHIGGKIGGKISGPKTAELLRKKGYFVEDRFYASSQQEGAVALLLEKYLQGHETVEGKTFQVRDRGISNGGIDFFVDGEFLEWHPIILSHGRRGDIPSREELKSYKRVVDQLSDERRKEFDEDYKKILAVNYRGGRQAAVDNSEYAGTSLALAAKTRDLYEFIERHGGDLPSYVAFKKEFRDNVKYVKSFAVKKGQGRKKGAA